MLATVGCSESDVAERRIEDPRTHWESAGYVELRPAAHVPSSSPERDQVVTMALLPEGSIIETIETDTGPSLRFGPGAVLDRVEFHGLGDKRHVIDVRGTRVDAAGTQLFHVYRKDAKGVHAPLFGFEWRAGDPQLHHKATQAFLDRLATRPPGKGMEVDEREAYLGRMRTKNDCAGCHVASRPANHKRGEHGLVNRRADASGFYTPLAVLADEVPVEGYGAHDLNEEDPFITVSCADGPVIHDKKDRPRCEDDTVPVARLDVAAGVAANDSHALAVCASRRLLFRHLDERGQELFADSLTHCPEGA